MTARLALAALLACTLLGVADEPPQPKAKPPAEPAHRLKDPFAIAELLQQPVTDDKPHDGIPLKDYLNLGQELGFLPRVVVRADRSNGQAALEDAVLDRPVSVPNLLGLRAEVALKLVCEQTETGYVIERDHVVLMPRAAWVTRLGLDRLLAELNPDIDRDTLPALAADYPVVTINLGGMTLEEAVGKLAERANTTVLVADEKLAKQKLPPGMKFINAPLDAAVKALARSVQAASSRDANVLSIHPAGGPRCDSPSLPSPPPR